MLGYCGDGVTTGQSAQQEQLMSWFSDPSSSPKLKGSAHRGVRAVSSESASLLSAASVIASMETRYSKPRPLNKLMTLSVSCRSFSSAT